MSWFFWTPPKQKFSNITLFPWETKKPCLNSPQTKISNINVFLEKQKNTLIWLLQPVFFGGCTTSWGPRPPATPPPDEPGEEISTAVELPRPPHLQSTELQLEGLRFDKTWSLSSWAMKKRVPGCLGYIGDEKLPNYKGIIINHCKDPYEPTSIMESIKVVFFVAQLGNEQRAQTVV